MGADPGNYGAKSPTAGAIRGGFQDIYLVEDY